jgi:hypothetical protein
MNLDQVNYSNIALEAAGYHRAIEATLREFESILPENPAGLWVIERFVQLHSEFYDRVMILTAKETWEIDADFSNDVSIEKARLRDMLNFIVRDKWFLERVIGKTSKTRDYWSKYFAWCVEDIFEGYCIDSKTNEIFFVMED